MHQELRRTKPEWIVQKRTFAEACRGAYKGKFLKVVYRWETMDHPDPSGVQWLALQKHVRDHPEIRWVWYEFLACRKVDKTPEEQQEFKTMLTHVKYRCLAVPA